MTEVYLGIDLGTTTTLIAKASQVKEKDAIEVKVLDIPQQDGQQGEVKMSYLPSVAYLNPAGAFSVGLEAQVVGPKENPSRFVRAVKRQMGRRVILREVDKKPYEISALYLEKALKEGRYQLPMGDMVFTVTVPASFTSNQRADTLLALKLACQNAGLPFPEKDEGQIFISEPVAAMLAFLNEEFERSEGVRRLDFSKTNRIVVYDIGGGTLDLTMVFIEPQLPLKNLADLKIYVDNIGYYNPFGGEDFDLILAQELFNRFLETNSGLKSVELTPTQRLGIRLQLMNVAKKIKENLSPKMGPVDPFSDEDEDNSYYYQTDSTKGEYIRVKDQNYSFEGEITVQEYKKIVENLLINPSRKSLVTPLRDLLEKSNLDASHIDGLLIVGGMGRLPLVEESLKEYWGTENKIWLYNPADHAVVTGAALYSLLRRRYPGFSLQEPAADAYYVRLEKRFDLILPSKTTQGDIKSYELNQESDRLLLQLFAGEESPLGESIENIYHTLIYQGGTSIKLGKKYPKGTHIFVQMLYEKEKKQDHTKLPWIYIWLEKQSAKPDFKYRYSDFVKEAHDEKGI
jgi:molecular chaperone DnaK